MRRDIQKPYENEHACRLKPPNYPKFARDECQRKIGGKCVDVILGIRSPGRSEPQSLRFKSSIWSREAAASYCRSQGGQFEAAKRPTVKGAYFRIAAPETKVGDFYAPSIVVQKLDEDDTVRVMVGKRRDGIHGPAVAECFLFRKDAWTVEAAKQVVDRYTKSINTQISKGFKPKLSEA